MLERIKKRVLPMLLALLTIGGMLPGFDFTIKAYAEEASSGNWTDYAAEPASDPADATGKTYIIDSPEKLAWIASQINSATPNTFGGYTLNITANIDLSGHYWVPIGNSSANSFQGTVQGHHQEISGLTIGSAASPDTVYAYKGLFGYINNATINDVVLKKAAIYSGTSSSAYIGGLAGYADNNSVTVSGCSATGYFYSNGAAAPVIGGLLGYQAGNGFTAVNSWSQSIIYNNKLGYTGGLIGDARGTGSIKNCFAAGKIFGNKSGGTPYVGGLLGNNANGMAVTNSFTNCIISAGMANAGGIAGQDSYGVYSNVYAAGTINAAGSSSGMFIGYTMLGTVRNGYWNTSAVPKTSKSVGGMLIEGSATGQTQSDMTAGSFCTVLNVNADALRSSDPSIKDWIWDSGTNSGFPYLAGVGDFSAPLPPTVINPVASGTAKVDETLVLSYTFLDVKDHAESGSAIQWYRADHPDGSGAVPITDAHNKIYKLTSADASKYIYAVITPSNGSITGAPIQSATTARVDGGSIFPGLGSGTAGDPYQIYTVDDLKNIALAPDSHYLLMNDITAGLDSVICTGGTSVFNGHFDGGGHTVTLAVDADTGQYTGMFGVVGSTGNIHDLNITGSVSGLRIIGGIAAGNQGTISDCTSNAVVLASGSLSANVWAGGIAGENTGTIEGCSVTGTVSTDSLMGNVSLTAGFGGIAGHSSSAAGLITDCHVNMTSFSVTAATFGAFYCGGIVGLNQYAGARIENCYTENDLSCSLDSGDINSRVLVGGIAGHNDRGSITGCFATGGVTGGGECGVYAGGLAGQCSGSYDSPSTVVLSDSYYWGTVSGNDYVGGLVGYLYSAALSYCYSAGSVSGGSGYTGGLVGYNASGNTEYCYSNSYGRAAGGRNGGLYGGRGDIPGSGAAGAFWNSDNTSATYGDDANHLYPIGTSLSAIQMTGANASLNMPGLDFTTPHFVTKDSTPTERYFPQLAIFANSLNGAVRAASLESAVMAYEAPSITTQPGIQTVTAGENAEFTVAAAGGQPLSYQWKKDGVSLSDGGRISGAAAAALAISNVQKADEGSYLCYVSNASGGLDSASAALTVNLIKPSVTTPPSAQTVTEGGTARFTVAASGTAPLSYQWKKDGVSLSDGSKISGATTAALTVSNAQKADEGAYSCYINNDAGDVTSGDATLTVNLTSVKPAIAWQPEDKTASAGWTVNFFVTAHGTAPLAYRWEKDGVDLTDGGKISGATTDSLIIGNVQESEEGVYTCYVSNAAGETASNSATLTVDPVKPSVATQPANQTRTVGDDVSFTVLAAGSEPFTYRWSKNGVALTDGGAVSGTATAALAISGIQTSDEGNYSCTVSNDYGNVTSSSAPLTVNLTHEAPTIAVQPVSHTVPAGQAAVFIIEAAGNTPLTYQWYKDGAALENAGCYTGVDTPELHIGSVITDYAGTYTCLVTNDYGSAASNEAVLTVGTSSGFPPAITTTSLPDGAVGTPYSQTLVATGTAPVSWYFIGELPAGLTLSLSTGIISGTPTTIGTFNFTVRAENTDGGDTQDLSITIKGDVLTINTPSLAAATVGALYDQTIAVTYTGSGTLAFSAAGLPDGLAIRSSTGEINGTPDAGSNTSSPYSVGVTVTDGTLTDTKTYSLTVDAAATYMASVSPTQQLFTAATVGYSQQPVREFTIENTGTGTITSLAAQLGGSGFEISTALSTASLNAGGTATVSVRPKTGLAANTYTDTLTITGSNGIFLTANLSFTVNAAPVVNATIDPVTGSFDKKTANQADVRATIAWGSAGGVSDVKAGGTSIGAGNYDVSGNTLTIKKEYLMAQSTGSLVLTVEFNAGAAAALTITITDTTPPAISPTFFNYDLNAPADVSIAITWNSAASLTNVAYSVSPDTTVYTMDTGDYALIGNDLTINDSFFTDISVTTGNALVFTITFDTDATATLTVNIVDSYVPGNNADLSSLSVNGAPVSDFDPGDPDGTEYDVELPYGAFIAAVTATASDPNARVNITQAPSLPGSATVTVTAEDGTATKTYTIHLTIGAAPAIPVTSITITGTGGAESVQVGSTLQMLANVLPANATDGSVTWSISGSGANISASGLLAATAEGSVTVRAAANDSSGVYAEKAVTITAVPSAFVAVTDITGVPATAAAGVNLTLAGTVAPANATNKTIAWSVRDAGATGATITGGTLSATAAGTVVVRATIANGSTESTDYAQDFNITVSAAPAAAYTINASAGSGGGISPSGAASVTSGGSQTFTISADSGYRINAVTVDGAGQGAISSYSFTNVTANHTITAAFTYIGGGAGGVVIAPSTPEYKADVDAGNGWDTTLPVHVDKNSGSAVVDVGAGINFMFGGKTTVVTVPSVPDVDAYTLGIPVPKLTTPGEQGKIAFKTDNGSVTIPSNMLTGVDGITGSKAQISIGQGDKSTLPEDIKTAIGERPLVQLTLSIDGKQTNWSNPNAPVTVSIPYAPTADELKNPESIVIWYIDGSGNVVTIPNGHYDPATGAVTFVAAHFSCYAVVYNKENFNDVAAGAWYYKAVSFIAARDITGGTGNGNYRPDARLTRGEFLVMLMKAYGVAPDTNPADNFFDAGSTYYTGYLAAAKRLGITAGTGNNQYAPAREITRQEMFTLLYKALKVIGRLPRGDSGKILSDFTDAGQIDSWAKGAMTLLVETGTVSGNDGKLRPLGTTTRAEMAQILYHLLEN